MSLNLNFLTERGYLPPDQLNNRDWGNITLSREDARTITAHIFSIAEDINPVQFLSIADRRIMLYFYCDQDIDYSWFSRRLEVLDGFTDKYRANCTDYGILVAKRNIHKGNALEQFASMINLPVDRIAKFGDQGQKGGNDHELLVYPGSFSVYRHDKTNINTFNSHEAFNISNAAGTLWVLERLNFVSPSNTRIEASHDMPFIQFKQTYQAAAFDMDGTLISDGESRPSDEMYRMLAALLENGIPIAIITARNADEIEHLFLRGLEGFLDEPLKNLFFFLCNGAALLKIS